MNGGISVFTEHKDAPIIGVDETSQRSEARVHSTYLAVRLARPLDSYPPIHNLSPQEVCHPCACGLEIVQRCGEDIVHVVAAHNAHPMHQSWRERRP